MNHPIPLALEKIITEGKQELVDLIVALTKIPAPSHHEELRAEFCKNYLESFGATGVYIDEAKNVVWPIGCEGSDELTLFLGHIDLVFPDTTELPCEIRNGRIYSPGVGDNTANAAGLMYMAKTLYGLGYTPKKGVLIVLNSCEEGLGNLKGARQIMKDYEGRISEAYSFDGHYESINHNAVGSKRYKIVLKTEGGHSYVAYGNKSAIHYMANLITTIMNMKVPTKAKTTHNVGTISGGTSVNTIAQQAEMMYEYRSEDRECLAIMDKMFFACIEAYRAMGIDIEVTVLGERPCKGVLDEEKLAAMVERTRQIVVDYWPGNRPDIRAGSTDCNIPLSQGVPAICVGVCLGHGMHTREEYIELNSLDAGMKIAAAVMLHYYCVE